jgi:DNA-binding GntR family transcriptional regulator
MMIVKKDITSEKLHELIKDGYFRPGESISEREIAEMLGVSRTPVREAFRRLEKDGLIVYQPMKGVTIKSFTVPEMIDLYRVREYIEGLATRLFTEKKREQSLEELQRNINQAEYAASIGDVKEQTIINGHFHQTIVDGTENMYLINIYRPLITQISLIRSTSLSYQDRSIINIGEHKDILAAIKAGDADKAEELSRVHVRNSLQAALNKFNS